MSGPLDEKLVELWAVERKGAEALKQFQEQAASILSRMSATALFSASRVSTAGVTTSEPPPIQDGKGIITPPPGYHGTPADIVDDKVANILNADGSVDTSVLQTCLAKLDAIPVCSIADPNAESLSDKFRITTGRDRLLDFMATKTRNLRAQVEDIVRSARRSREISELIADASPALAHLYETESRHQQGMELIQRGIKAQQERHKGQQPAPPQVQKTPFRGIDNNSKTGSFIADPGEGPIPLA